MIKVTGKGGITAKVIADSIANGIRLTTLELYYHQLIHKQFMTHRMLSRNASSGRAIPANKVLEKVRTETSMPIFWGKDQPGMQADEENVFFDEKIGGECYQFLAGEFSPQMMWKDAAHYVAKNAAMFADAGYHKQIVNRLTEPFQHIKVIVTATEWDNFFALRLHHASQPEIQELARCMKEAMDSSVPTKLSHGEWHLPYVEIGEVMLGTKAEAIKCSVARCARVSYNNHDNSTPGITKDTKLADTLQADGHMSPFEHQATPLNTPWEDGCTHMDRKGNFWSGNFRGWIQNRQLLGA